MMAIQTLYSAKRIEQQFHTGEEPVNNGQRPSGRTSWIVLTKTLDNMKYSIIYAVIRPEISERVSLGLIFVDGDKVDVRYSQQKLEAVRGLFSPKEYEFLSEVVRSLPTDGSISTVDGINYLTRYSNNLIAVSPLQSIDIAATEQSKDSLFRNYIYEAA